MSDQTLFGDTAPASGNAVQPDPSTQPQDQGVAGILVGEGRKYKDIEALIKGHLHLDSFAEQLKEENRLLREKQTSAATIEDVLSKLTETKQAAGTTTDQTAGAQPTAADIVEQVKKALQADKSEETKASNRSRAEAAMKELFGDKAKDVFNAMATTPEERHAFALLAEANPERFIAVFKPADKPMPGMATSTVNAGAPTGSNRVNDPGTKEYWDNMMRTDIKKFMRQDQQLAKQNAAIANPGKYWNR